VEEPNYTPSDAEKKIVAALTDAGAIIGSPRPDAPAEEWKAFGENLRAEFLREMEGGQRQGPEARPSSPGSENQPFRSAFSESSEDVEGKLKHLGFTLGHKLTQAELGRLQEGRSWLAVSGTLERCHC
jgi:hypothetical protein